jgi:KipI family sensor histidine kinase inhibitor
MKKTKVKILPSGDTALLVRFGEEISESLHQQVQSLYNKITENEITGIREMVPAYADLMILYAPMETSFKKLYRIIEQLIKEPEGKEFLESRQVEIPVCYHPSLGPDQENVSRLTRLTTEEIIQIHSQSYYTVYMLGFTPGFVYLGGLDKRIACSRKSKPEASVPAGAVGIAGHQTGIYPIESPGGWQIIGQTPVKLFDLSREDIFLCKAGDRVRFVPISLPEFEAMNQN